RDASQRLLDVRSQLLRLLPRARVVSCLEVGQDAIGKQLEGGADVLVAVVAALLDENAPGDPAVPERLNRGAHLVGVAEPTGGRGRERRRLPEALPDVRARRDVGADDVVVRQGGGEELEDLEPRAERRLL